MKNNDSFSRTASSRQQRCLPVDATQSARQRRQKACTATPTGSRCPASSTSSPTRSITSSITRVAYEHTLLRIEKIRFYAWSRTLQRSPYPVYLGSHHLTKIFDSFVFDFTHILLVNSILMAWWCWRYCKQCQCQRKRTTSERQICIRHTTTGLEGR